jgi:hypothetical protein
MRQARKVRSVFNKPFKILSHIYNDRKAGYVRSVLGCKAWIHFLSLPQVDVLKTDILKGLDTLTETFDEINSMELSFLDSMASFSTAMIQEEVN